MKKQKCESSFFFFFAVFSGEGKKATALLCVFGGVGNEVHWTKMGRGATEGLHAMLDNLYFWTLCPNDEKTNVCNSFIDL